MRKIQARQLAVTLRTISDLRRHVFISFHCFLLISVQVNEHCMGTPDMKLQNQDQV